MCFLELESDVGEKTTAWDGSKVFAFAVGKGLGRHGGERLGCARLLSRVVRTPSVPSCWLQSKDVVLREGEEAVHLLKDVLEANWRKQQSSSRDQRRNT